MHDQCVSMLGCGTVIQVLTAAVGTTGGVGHSRVPQPTVWGDVDQRAGQLYQALIHSR